MFFVVGNNHVSADFGNFCTGVTDCVIAGNFSRIVCMSVSHNLNTFRKFGIRMIVPVAEIQKEGTFYDAVDSSGIFVYGIDIFRHADG